MHGKTFTFRQPGAGQGPILLRAKKLGHGLRRVDVKKRPDGATVRAFESGCELV
jgi:hypothetical protein